MFNFIRRFIKNKRVQTIRFLRMYTEYTFTEYDAFFEPPYTLPKEQNKKEKINEQ
jgi:hypothetical protein